MCNVCLQCAESFAAPLKPYVCFLPIAHKINGILSLVTSKAPLAFAGAARLTNTQRHETDFPLVEAMSKPACDGIHREQRWCVSGSKTAEPSSIIFQLK